jgi:hypothetical protein
MDATRGMGATRYGLLVILLLAASAGQGAPPSKGTGPVPSRPILFVTQVPIPDDFATIGSTFANHEASVAQVGRGGDLYIRYPDGALRNLTAQAGYGVAGAFQGAGAIAVRDPAVHWSGTKALFSMVVGAPTEQYQVPTQYWQMYEVTGLGAGETAVIGKIPLQPADYNNLTPIYSPDGRILFTSDRPRSGERHLYPQHDEYESTATNTGLWSLDPATGDLHILDHSPSGVFTPRIDSYGRVVFTRWDHLQRDQQADTDALYGNTYGTFDYADESAAAAIEPIQVEVFPEPRDDRIDLLADTNLVGHRINHFFPWEMNPDGTSEETLNHVGRHELHDYFDRVFDDDPNLEELIGSGNRILNLFQIQEDPTHPGRYVGVDAPEFQTHAAGRIVALDAPPGLPADQITVDYLTHPDTFDVVPDGDTPPATHTGHYRDPLPLSDGVLLAVHTSETRAASNDGSRAFPIPRYHFRLRLLQPDGAYLEPGVALTGGISRTVRYWDPDVEVTYSGELWELQPAEVIARSEPPLRLAPALESPEAQIFADEGVDPEQLRHHLRERDLALVISRDVTTRDAADRQQPFNLRVDGGSAQTVVEQGPIYDVAYLQIFQADQVRGIGGVADPEPGRRVLARALHDPNVQNPPTIGPAGSVGLGSDGSMAAFVPARRALSWQLTDVTGESVIRERYWLTFQPGEIRLCTSCHGLNTVDQAGQPRPGNSPEALRQLLQHWRSLFADGFESGDATAWGNAVGN